MHDPAAIVIKMDDSDDRSRRRWNTFDALLAADDDGAGVLRDAYERAIAEPGRWVVSVPIVSYRQLLRMLLGLSWETDEPQMAFRFDEAASSIELAFAEKVVPARQMRPGWIELFLRGRKWSVQWV